MEMSTVYSVFVNCCLFQYITALFLIAYYQFFVTVGASAKHIANASRRC